MLSPPPVQRPSTWVDYVVLLITTFSSVINICNRKRLDRLARHAVTTYALGRVQTYLQGAGSGTGTFFVAIFRGIFEVYYRPDWFARRYGAFGCLFGLAVMPFAIVFVVLKGLLQLFDKCFLGCANGCCHKDKLYVIDQSARYSVYPAPSIEEELLRTPRPTGAREMKLRKAIRMANNARALYNECDPAFPKHHWHFTVVPARELWRHVGNYGTKSMGLARGEKQKLISLLRREQENAISFSKFCLYIGEAIKARYVEGSTTDDLRTSYQASRDRNPTFEEIYALEPEPDEETGAPQKGENDEAAPLRQRRVSKRPSIMQKINDSHSAKNFIKPVKLERDEGSDTFDA